MAKDVDLSSKAWRDIVFEGKNKEFGAYKLREGSVKRHNLAMIAVVVFIIACFLVTLAVKSFSKEEDVANTAIDQDAAFAEYEEEEIIEDEIDEPEYIEPEVIEVPQEEILNTQAVTELEIVPPDQVTTPPAAVEEQMADERAVGSVDQTGGSDDIIRTYHETKVQAEIPKPEPPKVEENKVFDHVEQMPLFPGGESALLQWVTSHIKYPTICQENNIQGRVVVQFVVTKDGSVGDVKVVRPKDPDLDKEAVRVVRSLPKFTPGKQNGIPVNVWYTLPITFKLQQ